MNIEQIEEKLRIGQNSPHDLAEMRAFLSGAYSFTAGQLQEILGTKPMKWLEIRKTVKSVAEADRTWEASPDGIQETKLEWDLKRIQSLRSGIKSLLEVAEGEAKNTY